MKTLIVIESPGKRKKLESILGAGYSVQASFGHIRDLPDKEIGVESPNYNPRYVVNDARSKKTIANLKAAAARADRVVLATDPDREGEAIAWHVAEVLQLKKRERIAYHEITAKAVMAALAAPRPIDMNLVKAQEARRVLDRLVGYKVSPALSIKSGRRMSAGRVQSPAVRLVVERERAIRTFQPTTHFGARIAFSAPARWHAEWDTKPFLNASDHLLDKDLAERVASSRTFEIVHFEDGIAKSAPPAPFTTSTLQQRAQTELKLKPKHTMEIAQRLYEQGAITYMRTDSPNLSDEACGEIEHYANSKSWPLSPMRRRWKAKGNAQEAHEAIRPTHIADEQAGENEEEKALYRLIRMRTIASQLADAVFATRIAKLKASDVTLNGRAPEFVARGRSLVEKGWKAVFDEPDSDLVDDENDDDPMGNPVPPLVVGSTAIAESGRVVEKVTKAPPRYTLATLIKELEANGIGRPATYASILDNILTREYILEEKKSGHLSATSIGECVVDTLLGEFGFIELDYTKNLENDLDLIADGKRPYLEVVAETDDRLDREIATVLGDCRSHPCPDCGAVMRRRQANGGHFWGCSAFPQCKTTLADQDGVPVARVVASIPCPDCGQPLRRNTRSAAADPKGKGWDFYGCTGYPGCRSSFQVASDGSPMIKEKTHV